MIKKTVAYRADERKQIAICVGIRNRSEMLLKHLLPSMSRLDNQDRIVLSICDCHSEDEPKLYQKIRNIWKGGVIYENSNMPFTRSTSINRAVEICNSNMVFLCDADMTLPKDFVSQMDKFVGANKAWFPICFSLNKDRPKVITKKNGFWRPYGYGMAGFLRKDFIDIGQLPVDDEYKSWGKEDTNLWNRCKEKMFVTREKCPRLFHNWHSDDMAFKNKFYNT